MVKQRNNALMIGILIVFLALGGCSLIAPSPPSSPPAMPLPALPDYNRVEGQTLTDYIGTVSGGAALLAGQPELAAAVAVVEGIASCYQDVGAVSFAVYSRAEEPLAAGALAIADRNALASPANLFRCVVPVLGPQRSAPGAAGFQPCQHTYTLETDDNEFYIAYAATQQQVCQAFCAELEACTAH